MQNLTVNHKITYFVKNADTHFSEQNLILRTIPKCSCPFVIFINVIDVHSVTKFIGSDITVTVINDTAREFSSEISHYLLLSSA